MRTGGPNSTLKYRALHVLKQSILKNRSNIIESGDTDHSTFTAVGGRFSNDSKSSAQVVDVIYSDEKTCQSQMKPKYLQPDNYLELYKTDQLE